MIKITNETIMTAIDLSVLSYSNINEIESALENREVNIEWYENFETDTQVLICETSDILWCVFRGTEFTNLNDWATNLDCRFRMTPWGEVHKGFRDDVESIETVINPFLHSAKLKSKPIIITGHSQGASDAEQLFMKSCYLNPAAEQYCIPIAPPRSMSKSSALNFGTLHGHKVYHIINNNDVVTRVPPRFTGFSHTVNRQLRYLDEDGNVHENISWWKKFLDRIKGRMYDFGKLGTDGLKDHSSLEYQRIWRNIIQ